MIDEEKLITTAPLDASETENEEKALDNAIASIPLDEQQKQIVNSIIEAPTAAQLQEQFDLFNINQSKKNALRIIKLNGLLDQIEDQAIERFEKRPDQVSNKELLDYMQVVASQIDRSQQFINTLQDKPAIKVTQHTSEVNINIGTDLNRDSKEKVVDAIQALLKQLNKQGEEAVAEDIIEAEVAEAKSSEDSEEIVYNVDTEEDIIEEKESEGESI